MQFNFYGSTDSGKSREFNEDAFDGFAHGNVLFLMVADGLGGKEGADLASHIALNELRRYIERYLKSADSAHVGEVLEAGMYFANRVVMAYRRANDTLYGNFGTSLTVCAINAQKDTIVCHAGNTRLYFLRQGSLIPVTKDHTEAQRLVDQGKITKEEMMRHPERLSLTNGIGISEVPTFDQFGGRIQSQDLIILCTDGIYGMMSDDEIRDIVLEAGESKKACEWLIEGGNQRGGIDNMAVLLSLINF